MPNKHTEEEGRQHVSSTNLFILRHATLISGDPRWFYTHIYIQKTCTLLIHNNLNTVAWQRCICVKTMSVFVMLCQEY